MKKPKTNWKALAEKYQKWDEERVKENISLKARFLAAEKERDVNLNHWKESSEVARELLADRDKALQELINRPTLEKIVEKEVTPEWNYLVWAAVLFALLFLYGFGVSELDKLQTPILQPYAVYIYHKNQPAYWELKECKDSWREDELAIKVLRSKLKRHEIQEGE